MEKISYWSRVTDTIHGWRVDFKIGVRSKPKEATLIKGTRYAGPHGKVAAEMAKKELDEAMELLAKSIINEYENEQRSQNKEANE